MTPDEKTELHDVDAAIRAMRHAHDDTAPAHWPVGAQVQYERLRARRRDLLAKVGLPTQAQDGGDA